MAELPSSSVTHQKLRDHGLQPSKARVTIYEWLMKNPVHPTVEVIYNALRPQLPSLSRTTVYNVLHAFVERGLADKVHSEDLELRYDGNISQHAHFKCTQCGELRDLMDIPDSVSIEVGLPNGFEPHTTAVTLWGFCARCAKKKRKRVRSASVV
ncbi:MAG: transcriptional repressor [Kiritimatiellae bacterium]|nr:transcriptional repressor [Kiritimatiellia bacterium]